MSTGRPARCAWAAPALLLLPAPAYAHSSIAGVGDFYAGMAHPFVTPAHALVLVALGAYLGRHWPEEIERPVVAIALASAIGLACTLLGPLPISPELVMLGAAMALGALLTLDKRVSAFARDLLLGAAALLIGLDSALEGGQGWVAVKTLSGTWVAVQVAILNAAFYASSCRTAWAGIGLRVLGSWIVAIALMVSALTLAPGRAERRDKTAAPTAGSEATRT